MIQDGTPARVMMAVGLLLAALCSGVVRAEEQVVYVIGPNDVLAINVYGQPQLSGKYAVEGDGTFTFPLLGRVRAGGLSLESVESEVRNRLARGYLNNPQVTIAVDQYRSQQIFVMGEVRQPGTLPLVGQMTLLEALARAGSTTERAGQEALVIHTSGEQNAGTGTVPPPHADGGDPNAVHVDLQSLQSGALAGNIVLRPGDTVFVPRAATVFVSGYVRNPGEYLLRNGLTVRQAVALAGGTTERGSLRRIQIIRRHNGAELKTDAALGDLVQPGDTIFVREKFF